jgi:hypothetical protein
MRGKKKATSLSTNVDIPQMSVDGPMYHQRWGVDYYTVTKRRKF